MKQKFVLGLLCVLLAGLAYSADLEGPGMAATQGDLPETGLYAASNDFSLNSTVHVTNLENGRTVQVVVSKGLGANRYGVLLALSREAANALGLYGQVTVRMKAALSDSADLSRFSDGRSFSGDPDYDSRAFVRSNALPFSGTATDQTPSYPGTGTVQPFHTYSPLAAEQAQSYPGTGTATVQPFHTYSPPNNSGSSVTPFSDGLSSGQYVPPAVVAAPPTPVDPVFPLTPPVVQDLSTPLSSGRVHYPETARGDRAAATGPYQDPKDTEFFFRSPDIVVSPPLPEMGGTARVTEVSSSEPGGTARVAEVSGPEPTGSAANTQETAQTSEMLREQEQPEIEGGLAVIPEYSIMPSDGTAQGTPPQVFSMDDSFRDTGDMTLELPSPEPDDSVGNTEELAQAAEPLRAQEQPEVVDGLDAVPEYSLIPSDVPGSAPTFSPETVARETVTATGQPEVSGIGGGESLPDAQATSNDVILADSVDVIDLSLYDGNELLVSEEPEYFNNAFNNVDAVMPLGEPMSAAGDTGLYEPGYAIVGNNREDANETASVPENMPPGSGTTPAADATALLGEPESFGNGGFAEPGYTVSETESGTAGAAENAPVPDGGIPAADATALLGEPAVAEGGGLLEPGYAFIETEDGITGAAENIPAADMAALTDEPVFSGEGGFVELGYAFLEIEDETALVAADATALLSEPAFSEAGGLLEPGYAFIETEDGTGVAENAPVPDGGIPAADMAALLGEPGYTIRETEDGIAGAAENAPVPDGGTPAADATTLLREPAFSGEDGLVEPGYAFLEIEDETTPAGADATALWGEPVSAGEDGLAEPGYVFVSTGESETFGVGGGEPLPNDAVLADGSDIIEELRRASDGDQLIHEESGYAIRTDADTTVLLREPASAGAGGLDEPGYVIREVVEETGGADAAAWLGEPASAETGGLVEPAYSVLGLEDEITRIAGSVPVGGTITAEAAALPGEPASAGAGGLVEPGYIIREVVEETGGADAAAWLGEPAPADEAVLGEPAYHTVDNTAEAANGYFGIGGGEEFGAFLAEPGFWTAAPDTAIAAAETGATDEIGGFNEPAYTVVHPRADTTALLGEPAFADGGSLDEPNYFTSIETIIFEPGSGTAVGEERRDTVPTIMVVPSARPDEEKTPPDVITVSVTSIETDGGLEAGMYYVQIGGYSNMTRVEAIMNELGGSYPLVLMGKRYILIGPLNEGESNAVELQFRAKGFVNAFVVRGKASR
jgi:hypothetical protein